MSLTWKEIFKIVKKFSELNQSEIAARLGIHPSTITRAKAKTGKFSNLKSVDIYEKIFARKDDDEKFALEQLREIVNEVIPAEDIKNLNTDDYKTFVIGLLRLVIDSAPSKCDSLNGKCSVVDTQVPSKCDSLNGKCSVVDTQIPSAVISQSSLPPEQMCDIFSQAMRCGKLNDFIASTPPCSLNSDFFKNVDLFITIIENNIMYKFPPSEEPYQNIIEFSGVLTEYSRYLKNNTESQTHSTDRINSQPWSGEKLQITPYQIYYTYIPSNGRDNNDEWRQEFETKTTAFHQKLKALHRQIINTSNK